MQGAGMSRVQRRAIAGALCCSMQLVGSGRLASQLGLGLAEPAVVQQHAQATPRCAGRCQWCQAARQKDSLSLKGISACSGAQGVTSSRPGTASTGSQQLPTT